MSKGSESALPNPESEPEDLQFDHAEFENAEQGESIPCAACRQPIEDHYYEINGLIVCEPCRDRIESQIKGGSGFIRLVKASVLGKLAAILSAAIYFAVLHFLGIQAGLVSILCGYLVGKAVMKGSGNRGGWIYQGLAMFLTYLAIGMAYTAQGVTQGMFDFELPIQPGQPAPTAAALLFVKVLAAILSTFVLPVLIIRDTQDFFLLLIILIAIWEAWKFTKRSKVVVTGPYRVGGKGLIDEPEGFAGYA